MLYDLAKKAKEFETGLTLDVDQVTAKNNFAIQYVKEYYDPLEKLQGAKTTMEKMKAVGNFTQYAKDATTLLKLAGAAGGSDTIDPLVPESAAGTVNGLLLGSIVLDRFGSELKKLPGPTAAIGEMFIGYSVACKNSEKAANIASKAVHGQGIKADYQTPYKEELQEILGPNSTIDLSYWSSLSEHDRQYEIMTNDNGLYYAFDENKKALPVRQPDGTTLPTMTDAQYRELCNLVMAYDAGRDKSAPKLTTKQAVDLLNGKTVKLKTQDGWLSDEYKDLSGNDILRKAEQTLVLQNKNQGAKRLDKVLESGKGLLGGLLSGFGQKDRMNDYKDFFGTVWNPAMIRLMGEDGYPPNQIDQFQLFLGKAEALAGKGLSWEDVKLEMAREINRLKKQKTNVPSPGPTPSGKPGPSPTTTAKATNTPKPSPTGTVKPSPTAKPTPKKSPAPTPRKKSPTPTPTESPTKSASPTGSSGGGGGKGGAGGFGLGRRGAGSAAPSGGASGNGGASGSGGNGPQNSGNDPGSSGGGGGFWGGGAGGSGGFWGGGAGGLGGWGFGPGAGGMGYGGVPGRRGPEGPGGAGAMGPMMQGADYRKPNIYLYGENTTYAVRLAHPGALTASIPAYPAKEGWVVTADADGLLDGRWPYLFYEATLPAAGIQREHGWIIEPENRERDFRRILAAYGFSERETQDFMDYWVDQLQPDTRYVAWPQETDYVDRMMPVSVEPKPASWFRLWFVFSADVPETVAEPETVTLVKRADTTLVEWGGAVE